MRKALVVSLVLVFALCFLPMQGWAPNFEPCIDIDKHVSVDGGITFFDADTCDIAPTADSGAMYEIIVTNCGNEPLVDVVVEDDFLGFSYPIGDLAPGEVMTLTDADIPELSFENLCDAYEQFENVAVATGVGSSTALPVTDADPACVKCEEKEDEGCTPGYWKNPKHFDSWTDYEPGDSFSSVFGRVITIRLNKKDGNPVTTDPTLLQALKALGGEINALARHSVAALLDASSLDVDFPFTTAEVIAEFQNGYDSGELQATKDLFEEANESFCPLD
jgi:hypothetical protein